MTDAQKWLLLATVAFGGWLLYLLAPVLTPFLIGALLSYLGDPAARFLQRFRLSRTGAVCIVFAAMVVIGICLLLILIPILQQQLESLASRLPQLIELLESRLLPWVTTKLGVPLESVPMDTVRETVQENWRDIGNILGLVLGKVSASGQALVAWIAYLVLVPVVTFYFMRDWDELVARCRRLLPRRHESNVVRLVVECDEVLSEFLRGQLTVMLALGVIYTVGLWLAGLEFALLIGMLAGLVSFVPYLGAIIGIAVAGVVSFIQYHDFLHLFYVALVFGIGQAIEGMVLSPTLVGQRIGLHPVAVIFAIMAGGQLFGFTGILLALPVAAVVIVLLRFAHGRYLQSDFYTP